MIEGIKITSISITKDKEDGRLKMSGGYELVSANGITLAKQTFNGYNDITLSQSTETAKALNELFSGVQKDLNTTLGIG